MRERVPAVISRAEMIHNVGYQLEKSRSGRAAFLVKLLLTAQTGDSADHRKGLSSEDNTANNWSFFSLLPLSFSAGGKFPNKARAPYGQLLNPSWQVLSGRCQLRDHGRGAQRIVGAH